MLKPLPVPYTPQLHDGYCLPACAAMVLGYYRVQATQADLARLMATGAAGTPFSRLQRLQRYGLHVEVATQGTVELLHASLAGGSPVIVAVHGAWLPDVAVDSPHAVVVVGLSEVEVAALDPALTAAAQILNLDGFLTAWIEMDLAYAVIRRA